MGRGPLSVTQLGSYIKGVFEDELVLHNIAVYGEIFECSVSNGITFLTLKEGDCVLSCVRYDSSVREPVGQKVLLTGTVTFYPKGGRVCFIYRSIEPYGESVLYAAFLRLKEKLAAEGVFARKQPLPAVIRSVAVITSETGAVIHDIMTVLKSRNAFAGVTIWPVKVQGEGAAEDIARAVETVNARRPADVIVIARGGGANTDLAAFNTEIVARAVGNSKIPVISAVGHETDVTLCDYAASARAATPSVAAAIVAENNAATVTRLLTAQESLHRAAGRLVRRYTGRLTGAGRRIESAGGRKTAAAANRLKTAADRLTAGAERLRRARTDGVRQAAGRAATAAMAKITTAETALKIAGVRLESVNPLKVLRAGYAKVYKDGVEQPDTSTIRPSDEVKVVMQDGAFTAAVLRTDRR